MKEALLREIASKHLVPFFSGASLKEESIESASFDPLVDQLNDRAISFKVEMADTYKLVLTRRQPFSDDDIVSEMAVVESFVRVLGNFGTSISGKFKEDLLTLVPRRVVAYAVTSHWEDEEVILDAIDQMEAWSNKLYEGVPISAALGFRNVRPSSKRLLLRDFAQSDFGAVLSNGYNTLLEFNFEGRFINHRALKPLTSTPVYCPASYGQIADWTTVKDRRIAIALNRLGEILIFRDELLLFARRSGRWHFLTHNPVITQMGTGIERSIRKAIYSSCLDVSFARTGACIGLLDEKTSREALSDLISADDLLSKLQSPKSKAIATIVGEKAFRQLDRNLRRELLAIDGATILDHKGNIVAVGAILKIPAGSADGGGRLAASRTLGKLGLGVKVSQDGSITGFRRTSEAPSFRVM